MKEQEPIVELLELEERSPQRLGNAVLRFARMDGTEDKPELFYTVQGEGRYLGNPTVFARLTECNLHCSWCDTPYTWVWDKKLAKLHDQGKTYSQEDETVKIKVGEAVDQISGFKCNRLVITGGEPLIQKKNLIPMIKGLREKDESFWVEVETNGTIPPGEELSNLVNQFNVSPKLENSGNSFKERVRERSMSEFAKLPNADFKYVVSRDEDLPEIFDQVTKFNINPRHVFLMPEGRTREEVEQRQRELVELAKQYNFNLTTRLHVLIYGAKRGV